MSADTRVFFDTNILLYVAGSDEQKARHAEELIAQGGTTSVQVLNEIANVARRRMRLSWKSTRAFILRFAQLLDVVPLTVETHRQGLEIAAQYELSVYDAMILSAACEARCTVVYSEDMQHGLSVADGPVLIDPFRT